MAVRTCEVKLKSSSPYSQSRAHEEPKLPKENPVAYEERTWREKAHATDTGQLFIPAMGFKQGLDTVSKMLGTQIPGKGKATYTKHFLAGVLCESDVKLFDGKEPILKDGVQGIKIHCNADGVRGSGKRVWRWFPQVPRWNSTARFLVMDDTITNEIFEHHFREAGRFIGVGRFRPEKGGLNGRFEPIRFAWS